MCDITSQLYEGDVQRFTVDDDTAVMAGGAANDVYKEGWSRLFLFLIVSIILIPRKQFTKSIKTSALE